MTPWAAAALSAALVAAQAGGDPPAAEPWISVRAQAAALIDVVPEQDATELRPQVAVAIEAAPGGWARFRFDARAEALAADRNGYRSDARLRITEAWFEAYGRHVDARVGLGRLVWGRLDEVSPSDVVNPIDAARYLFEGRGAARLPVPFGRIRLFPSEGLTLETILVPVFVRGRFDELDEATSPFNLIGDVVIPPELRLESAIPEHDEPSASVRNLSGGVRALVTIGRMDVTALVYRGFEPFGPVVIEVVPTAGAVPSVAAGARLVEEHPRFTVVGADLETVSGVWAWRAEVVAAVEKSLASPANMGLLQGRTLDVGAGVDRRAGDYRLYAAVLAHHERSTGAPTVRRTDVNLVGSVERPLARERYLARGFVVINPGDGSAFLRGAVRWRASDRAAVDASAGTFLGTSGDRIGQFRDRDFAFVRFSYDF
jgi:hypothetical protein